MADPITYTFHGTVVSTLINTCNSAISILTTAKDEISKNSSLPSEQEILDLNFGDMLPFRVQPILCTKFPAEAFRKTGLTSAPSPTYDPSSFSDLSSVIEFFKQVKALYESIDAKAFNDAAGKSVDVPFDSMGKTLTMTGLADYMHSFCVPNAYFHINAMYMLLRNKGFKLGKGVYVGTFMSEQQKKDWAPLRG
ncbi:hypothetical protein IQ06DRAFT_218423 [Phaeosphaeriaceae sp. SRC1lsM3a]|nr:hypothetical protein IQ06DRAFT_218423 [Stagonospora sp. SRC1lsM3a]